MMTNENEEAIKKLKNILVEASENDDSICYVTSSDADALKAAIKALEMQPCEDCISREQAIEKSKPEFLNDNVVRETEKETIANQNYNKGWNDCNHEWIDILSKLPSVTPTRPKGKWIKAETKGRFYCSICGGIHNDSESGEWREVFDFKYHYCPNCGADMRESEDEE